MKLSRNIIYLVVIISLQWLHISSSAASGVVNACVEINTNQNDQRIIMSEHDKASMEVVSSALPSTNLTLYSTNIERKQEKVIVEMYLRSDTKRHSIRLEVQIDGPQKTIVPHGELSSQFVSLRASSDLSHCYPDE